jgi:hypothetical protein
VSRSCLFTTCRLGPWLIWIVITFLKTLGKIGHHFKPLLGGRALPLSGERQVHQPLALDNSLYFGQKSGYLKALNSDSPKNFLNNNLSSAFLWTTSDNQLYFYLFLFFIWFSIIHHYLCQCQIEFKWIYISWTWKDTCQFVFSYTCWGIRKKKWGNY